MSAAMTSELLVVGDIPQKFNRTYAARDRENPATIYEVNVARLTCTCPDFTAKRLDFPPGDVRRVCSHLYDKLYQTKTERAFDPIVQLFIRYGRDMLTFRRVEDAFGRFVVGFPFGPRFLRAIGVANGQPVLATYDLGWRAWSPGETPLSTAQAAAVLERMRRVYPEAFRHDGHA
jgi:hypothetical protein